MYEQNQFMRASSHGPNLFTQKQNTHIHKHTCRRKVLENEKKKTPTNVDEKRTPLPTETYKITQEYYIHAGVYAAQFFFRYIS